MIPVDLASAARSEADRLREARALVAGAGPFVADGPLVWITHRRRLRLALRRRVLLLYRSAYEDPFGRLVHAILVAVTVTFRGNRVNVREVDWSSASWLSGLDDGCRAWRESARQVSVQFAATRVSREHAIASIRCAEASSFQPGLFDRRAHRAHTTRQRDAAEFSTQLSKRVAAAQAAGTLTLRTHELLLVLIPCDVARV